MPLHQEWYRTTIAHNTVTVDGANQGVADGAAGQWLAEGQVTRFTGSADAVYPGVKLSRELRLSPGQLEDRFVCASETEHIYDWAFHAPGKLTVSVKTVPRDGPLGAANGYQHVTEVASASTDEVWTAEWENGGAKLTLRFKAAAGTQVFTGVGPGRDPADKVPVLIVRRQAANTVFDAVHRFTGR